ncbi:hypothetical protein FQA39_LY01611 [Lamprigera yunnana]|nr:hypothetical protein FQA39_LY01611 [Lamprigera yunnana]
MSISSNHKCICKLIVIIVMFDLVQCWKIGDTVDDIMTSLADNISDIVTTPVQEVEDTKTVMLLCQSNGKEHFFLFWQLPVDDIIVGPTNTFDNFKYDYEILSGNLTVRRVSNEDEGVYHCVSKGVENDDITARPVRMVVKKDSAEEKGAVNNQSNNNVGDIINEIAERQKRANNIIIYKLNESDNELSQVKTIIQDLSLNVNTNNIKIFRLAVQFTDTRAIFPKFMSGFTCGYCKLQTSNTLPESWELISNHNCLNNNNLAIDENNMVHLDEDDGNNPLEEYNQRKPTINVLEEVSQNIETKSSGVAKPSGSTTFRPI